MASRNRIVLLLALVLATSAVLAWWIVANGAHEATVAPPVLDGPGIVSRTAESSEPQLTLPLETELRAEADALQLELLVVREDGMVVPDASVMVFRDFKKPKQARTDAAGRARFERADGSGGVVVRAPGHALFVADQVDLSQSKSKLVMPEGRVLRGSVRVDGAPPGEVIALRLFVDSARLTLRKLPLKVTHELGRTANERDAIRFVTEPDGSFVIRGLPEKEVGYFECESPWFVDDGTRNPDRRSTSRGILEDGMVVHLARPVDLRLRLVRADGERVRDASVTFQDGIHEKRMSGHPDALKGQWARGGDRSLHVRILPWGKNSDPIAREFHLPQGHAGPWELGSIEIPAPPMLWLEVVDPEGKLLPDAKAYSDKAMGSYVRGTFNSEERRLQVEVGARTQGFIVEARGHVPQWVEVRALERELRVLLERSCRLAVTIPGFDSDSSGLEFLLTGPEPLIRSAQPPHVAENRVSKPPRQASTTLERDSHQARGNGWSREHLTPGAPMRLEIRDRRSNPASYASQGTALARFEIAPLSPGEQREMVLPITLEARELKIHVLEPGLKPVKSAYVSLARWDDGLDPGKRTNSKGETAYAPLYGDVATVWVRANGYPMGVLRDVPTDAREVTIVLDAPRTVHVELLAADGGSLPSIKSVSIDTGTSQIERAEFGENGWTLKHLPPGLVTIEVRTTLGIVRQVHDTANQVARVMVGERGRVRASYRVAPSTSEHRWAVALAPAGMGITSSRSAARTLSRHGPTTADLTGLTLGTYDVWLEQSGPELPYVWTRVGQVQRVVLDAEHSLVEVDLTP